MDKDKELIVIWTEYMKYRAELRGYDLAKVDNILRHSMERYYDAVTGRLIAVGKHENLLVMIAYEKKENTVTPITIHAITRKQINFRLKTGRFVHE